jgi:quercetin dioxygenase-like cupin family protein
MSFDPHGYRLGPDDGPQLWFLDTRMAVKAGGEQTGEAFTLIEWSAPAGFGPPLHRHDCEDEGFYVLDGAMSVHCGDRRWDVGPGEFVFLPRGIPHTFAVTDGPIRGLQIVSPAGFERFVAELGRPAERPGLPEPSVPDVGRLIETGQRYGHEILGG